MWKDKQEPPGPFPDPRNAVLAPWAGPQRFALTFSRNMGSGGPACPVLLVGMWDGSAGHPVPPGSSFPVSVHWDGNTERENCTETGQGYPGWASQGCMEDSWPGPGSVPLDTPEFLGPGTWRSRVRELCRHFPTGALGSAAPIPRKFLCGRKDGSGRVRPREWGPGKHGPERVTGGWGLFLLFPIHWKKLRNNSAWCVLEIPGRERSRDGRTSNNADGEARLGQSSGGTGRSQGAPSAGTGSSHPRSPGELRGLHIFPPTFSKDRRRNDALLQGGAAPRRAGSRSNVPVPGARPRCQSQHWAAPDSPGRIQREPSIQASRAHGVNTEHRGSSHCSHAPRLWGRAAAGMGSFPKRLERENPPGAALGRPSTKLCEHRAGPARAGHGGAGEGGPRDAALLPGAISGAHS